MGKPRVFQGYVDAIYTGDIDQRRSTISYVFTVIECVISWKAELQDIVTLSTKYMVAVEASKKTLWLRALVETLNIIQDLVWVHCDGQVVIHLAKDHRYHKRTKHINV